MKITHSEQSWDVRQPNVGPGWSICDGGCIRARSSFSDSVPSGAKQTHDHDPPLESLNVELTFYMYARVHVCENDAMLNMGIGNSTSMYKDKEHHN